MKVAIITGFFDETFYYREHAYADYLKNNETDHIIFTSNCNLPQKKNKSKISDSGKYNVLRFGPLFKYKDIVIINYLKELIRFSPDIVHVFDAQQLVSILAIYWASESKIPIIYDHELQKIPESFLGKLRFYLLTYPFIRYSLKKSSLIRIVTPAALNLLNRIYKVDVEKINMEHLGYSSNFKLDSNLPFIIENSSYYIMTSGYFDTSKNLESIIAGFLLSCRNNYKLKLLIIGPIENVKLKRIIEKENRILHYENYLNFEQLNYLYSKINIHIWPKSTSSIFEALKFNKHIILNLGEDTSHLKSKQISLISNFNLFSISEKINDLLSKPIVSDNLDFSYERILDRLYDNYIRLTNKNN